MTAVMSHPLGRAATAAVPQRGASAARGPRVPPLVNGDRLTQPEFHRRYKAMPPHVRAELIGGIVYMASPLRLPHGDKSQLLSTLLGNYRAETPGVTGADNATAILGPDSEPQPDLHLRLLPECGGRARVSDQQYLVGPPELIIEVAHSTVAIDLHAKRDDYRRAGVGEYLVLCIEEAELRAFDPATDRALPVPADGVYRSAQFPGLWVDVNAVLAGDASKAVKAGRRGLASAAHKAFVRRLKAMLAAPATPKKRNGGR